MRELFEELQEKKDIELANLKKMKEWGQIPVDVVRETDHCERNGVTVCQTGCFRIAFRSSTRNIANLQETPSRCLRCQRQYQHKTQDG